MKSKKLAQKVKESQVEPPAINFNIPDNKEPENLGLDRLLQLHLAEYNALTSRATQQMITVVIIFIGLLSLFGTTIAFLDKLPALVFWVIVFSAQVGGIVAAWLSYEERNVTFYIETTLRQKIELIVNVDDFWKYEDHLLKNRKRETSYIKYPVIIMAAAIIVFVIFNRITQWSITDTIGMGFNVMVAVIFAYIIYLCFNVQEKMWMYLKKENHSINNDV